ncbi:MAG: methyltransferase domain-containing protein, partial [Chloroflexi bacterium]
PGAGARIRLRLRPQAHGTRRRCIRLPRVRPQVRHRKAGGGPLNEAERIAGVYREPTLRDGARWDLRNAGNRAILAERRDHMKRLLQRQGWLPLGDRKVLDVGCGGGAELAWFRELGASSLTGVDLLPERIEAAR